MHTFLGWEARSLAGYLYNAPLQVRKIWRSWGFPVPVKDLVSDSYWFADRDMFEKTPTRARWFVPRWPTHE